MEKERAGGGERWGQREGIWEREREREGEKERERNRESERDRDGAGGGGRKQMSDSERGTERVE